MEPLGDDHFVFAEPCDVGGWQQNNSDQTAIWNTLNEAMKRGSLGQLQGLVGYRKGRPGMFSALRRQDFAAMAYAYNGKDYGDYDKRFERAYKRLGGKI